MTTLTIAIDARAAAEVPAGRGRFVRELLLALEQLPDQHRYVLLGRERWGDLDERFRWLLLGSRDPWWHVRAARAASADCDVLLSTNSYLTTWMTSVPSVAVVHDLLAFDRAMSPNRRSAAIERLTLGRAVRRAALLQADSQATADELVARFPAAAGRVRTVLLAAAPPRPGDVAEEVPPPGFVLAVGTLEPRKNLPRLVAAYAALAPELRRRHPLVVVGARGWREGETMRALESLGGDCIRLGHVNDATLAELYARCGVFCFPSLGEGFGLPVLEAMRAGAPVITSAVSSLPEVAGDAALLVDPLDRDALADAIARVLGDDALAAQLAERGRVRAGRFSWERTARETLAVLEEAAGRNI